jgi:hypothetical protein
MLHWRRGKGSSPCECYINKACNCSRLVGVYTGEKGRGRNPGEL